MVYWLISKGETLISTLSGQLRWLDQPGITCFLYFFKGSPFSAVSFIRHTILEIDVSIWEVQPSVSGSDQVLTAISRGVSSISDLHSFD